MRRIQIMGRDVDRWSWKNSCDKLLRSFFPTLGRRRRALHCLNYEFEHCDLISNSKTDPWWVHAFAVGSDAIRTSVARHFCAIALWTRYEKGKINIQWYGLTSNWFRRQHQKFANSKRTHLSVSCICRMILVISFSCHFEQTELDLRIRLFRSCARAWGEPVPVYTYGKIVRAQRSKAWPCRSNLGSSTAVQWYAVEQVRPAKVIALPL
jgi:hypothetical protein